MKEGERERERTMPICTTFYEPALAFTEHPFLCIHKVQPRFKGRRQIPPLAVEVSKVPEEDVGPEIFLQPFWKAQTAADQYGDQEGKLSPVVPPGQNTDGKPALLRAAHTLA